MLADRWNLPEHFVSLIAEHTQMDELLNGGPAKHSAACVALASLLPSCSDEQWSEQSVFNESYLKLTQGSPEALAALFAEVDELTAEFAPLLKLPSPKKTLVEY
jgi:HD-like signal output (HDOD) protein